VSSRYCLSSRLRGHVKHPTFKLGIGCKGPSTGLSSRQPTRALDEGRALTCWGSYSVGRYAWLGGPRPVATGCREGPAVCVAVRACIHRDLKSERGLSPDPVGVRRVMHTLYDACLVNPNFADVLAFPRVQRKTAATKSKRKYKYKHDQTIPIRQHTHTRSAQPTHSRRPDTTGGPPDTRQVDSSCHPSAAATSLSLQLPYLPRLDRRGSAGGLESNDATGLGSSRPW
jgi:hypothetical protein